MTLSDASWVVNMILKVYLLKDMIIVWSENKDESTDKDESVDLSDIAPLVTMKK